MNSAPKAHPSITALGLYPTGESWVPGVSRIINLEANELAVTPSAAVLAAYAEAGSKLNRYGDGTSAALRQALGELHGLDPARIVCTNGSASLIQLLASSYCGPGDEVAMDRYAYLYFGTAARIAGATPLRAADEAFGAALAPNLDRLLGAVSPRTRLVFLDNPNNPTGGVLDSQSVAELRHRLREDILLVIDAAYAEYVTEPGYDPGVGLVEAGANCVMLRTFSKIYGLAGARLGWAYCPAEVADVLNRIRLPSNPSIPAQAAGLAALAEPERVAGIRRENDGLRVRFAERLAALGLAPAPSQGNFVLARMPADRSAETVYEALKAQGIMARPMSGYGLTDCLRFTIGTEEEMALAATALTAIMTGP